MKPGRFVAMLLLLLAAPVVAYGAGIRHRAPADTGCPVAADPEWTPQEQFVWRHLCAGEAADFNAGQEYAGSLEPRSPKGWPDDRILRPEFLRAILLAPKYRKALAGQRVVIVGARFAQTLDFKYAQLANELRLSHCLFEKDANFYESDTPYAIDLTRSNVEGTADFSWGRFGDILLQEAFVNKIDMIGARVSGEMFLFGTVASNLDMNLLRARQSLIMENGIFGGVILTSAHVGGGIDLRTTRVIHKLDMKSLAVDGSLLMRGGSHFLSDIVLSGARIGQDLDLSGSEVARGLYLDGIRVGGSLLMRLGPFHYVGLATAQIGGRLDLAFARVDNQLDMNAIEVAGAVSAWRGQFQAVDLGSAHVGGNLDLSRSTVSKTLDLASARVDGSLLVTGKARLAAISLRNARIGGQVDFGGSPVAAGGPIGPEGADIGGLIDAADARIGGDLNLAGGTFAKGADLSGARIGGALRLAAATGAPARWSPGAALVLGNARADAVADRPGAWPGKVDASGFVYRSFAPPSAAPKPPTGARPTGWFVAWLARQRPYAPASYQRLATVLRDEGRADAADAVVYAGRERERAQATGVRYLWLTALASTTAYGCRLWRSGLWALGFIVAGAALLGLSGEGRRNGMPIGLSYSLDMLVPLIRLRERHYQIDLRGWVRYYFYVHKIAGYALAVFLIAAIF